MKAIETAPDRKALEAGFLILALLPRRTLTPPSIKEAARKIRGLRTRILRETSYEQCADEDAPSQSDWSQLWRGCTSLEPPGLRLNAGLVVPEYPLREPHEVSRCDLLRLSELVWHGMEQVHHEQKANASI